MHSTTDATLSNDKTAQRRKGRVTYANRNIRNETSLERI